jgi:hypothetical protein
MRAVSNMLATQKQGVRNCPQIPAVNRPHETRLELPPKKRGSDVKSSQNARMPDNKKNSSHVKLMARGRPSNAAERLQTTLSSSVSEELYRSEDRHSEGHIYRSCNRYLLDRLLQVWGSPLLS